MKILTKSLTATLIICIIIISTYFLIYYNYPEEQKKPEFTDESNIIDYKISPDNVTQGIFLEVKRIHKKGIEEEFRKIGNSWKKKPVYHYEANVDGALWISQNINEWDTGYIGWESFKDVIDEQEETSVDFKIFETRKKLFGKEDVEKESFNVIYDFKTGEWKGDDSFNDSDGYGHYNGKYYEIWFSLNQFDIDDDGIPYWTENNVLGTNPRLDDSLLDPDNDGIPTSWEWRWKYDPFIWDNHSYLDPDEDGLENIEEYEMEKWLANPFYKDIFCEVDFMDKGNWFEMDHILWRESQWMVIDSFSSHFITLHVDDGWPDGPVNGGGEYLRYVGYTIEPADGIGSEFYKNHFSIERHGIFRYIFVQAGEIGWVLPQTSDWNPDVISLPASKKLYFNMMLPPAITPRLHHLTMAVSFIHELGHSLGLDKTVCLGIDNKSMVGRNDLPPLQKFRTRLEAIEYWGDYESVMNYNKFGQYYLDYSNGSHGVHDFDDWSNIDLTYFQNKARGDYGVGDNYKN
ncbi:MAG: hypothetical protein V3S79_05970 [Candidatus Thermoplasmatota archaeon]